MDVGGGQWEFEELWSRTPLFVNRMLVAFLAAHCVGWTCAASQRENFKPVSRELRAHDHCWKQKHLTTAAVLMSLPQVLRGKLVVVLI